MDRKELGLYGEEIAKKYLENHGYKTITQNFHAQGGEIDLIMKNPSQTWVFVEVKTRRSNTYGSPKDAITKQKIEKMIKAIYAFFIKQKIKDIPNFDIEAVCIRLNKEKVFCEHIKNIGLE